MSITITEIDQEISNIEQMVSSLQTGISELALIISPSEDGTVRTWSDIDTPEEAVAVLKAYRLTLA